MSGAAIGFTGGTLDRADALRHDPDALAAAMRDPLARLLDLAPDGTPVVQDGRLGWAAMPPAGDVALLGLDQGRPRFVSLAGSGEAVLFRSPALMAALAALQDGEAATYAAARSLILWHGRHRFCANCGHGTAPFRAGWGRACPHCGAEHFSRVDPVVIMLAEHDGRVLLGRQASWPAGRYSALAGFLEPGESVEEAVAREVHEETGVRVTDVRYVASQPWPFPHAQLMIACIGRAADDAITLDPHELEDAIWVPRAAVVEALATEGGAFVPPPRYAIARTLLERWAAE